MSSNGRDAVRDQIREDADAAREEIEAALAAHDRARQELARAEADRELLERQIRALDPTIRALRRVVGSNWRPPAAPEQEERGKPARPGRKRPEVGPGREERVLAILRNAGAPVPARLVMEQSGFDDSVVYTALKQLREKGQVRFAGTAPNKQGRDVSLFATYPEEA